VIVLFFVILAAVLAAMIIAKNPRKVYQVANRIVALLLAAGVIWMFLHKAAPAADGASQRFYDARGNSVGTSTTYGNQTKFYDARGNHVGTSTRSGR
jgi:hypothetical protein